MDGYLAKTKVVRDTSRRFLEGIRSIEGLQVAGDPTLSLFEFSSVDGSDTTGAIADVMDDRGWNLDRQQGGLHLMISPGHAHVVDQFLADLADAVDNHGENRGKAATYGGVAE